MPALINTRHERFAQALAQLKTAQEAYIEAGYKPNRGNASTLKSKQIIRSRVREILDTTEIRADVSPEKVLRELGRIGFADIRRAVKWRRIKRTAEDGEVIEDNEIIIKDSDELDEDTAAAISQVSQTRDGIRVRFHDKNAALTELGRHFGLFKDKVEISGQVQIANVELLQKLTPEERAEIRSILVGAATREAGDAQGVGVRTIEGEVSELGDEQA
jgi:phage terminase small subunit